MRQGAAAWALLLALVAMWGSSFLFNKVGVATVPPATLVAGRLAIGALILLVVMRGQGLRLPPPGPPWWRFLALALVGNAIPFYLITWGQQVVDSALAGILMAVMPLTLRHVSRIAASCRFSSLKLRGSSGSRCSASATQKGVLYCAIARSPGSLMVW